MLSEGKKLDFMGSKIYWSKTDRYEYQLRDKDKIITISGENQVKSILDFIDEYIHLDKGTIQIPTEELEREVSETIDHLEIKHYYNKLIISDNEYSIKLNSTEIKEMKELMEKRIR